MRNRFRWESPYLYWGITAFAVVACSILFYSVVNNWSSWWDSVRFFFQILSPIVFGLIFAYLLTPLAKRLERLFQWVFRAFSIKRPQLYRRLVRALSVLIAVLSTLLAVTLLLIRLLPQVYSSIETLVVNSPRYLDAAISFVQRTLDDIPALEAAAINLLEEGENFFLDWVTGTLLPNIDLVIISVSVGFFGFVRVVISLLIGLILSIYIMYNRERFAAQIKKLVYSLLSQGQVATVYRGIHQVDRVFGRYLFARVLDSLFVGTVTFLFLTIMGMPHVALVTVVIAITNMIPFFGPFIGAIPSALLILMENSLYGLIFILFIIVLQQISGNIIGPRIMANTMGLSGFWVLSSILIGGGLFGFMGMLLGVPVFSLFYSALRALTKRRLERRSLPTDTQAYGHSSPPPPTLSSETEGASKEDDTAP